MKRPLHGLMLVLTLILSCQLAFSQTRQISGKVTDTKGEALIGASLAVKGTSTGTITDADGNFNLSIGNDATLIISYTGYVTKEEAVGARSVLDITLEESILELAETVVVGYGEVKKSDLTGAGASIKASRLENENPRTVQDMLRGNAAGLDVSLNTSAKGGGAFLVVKVFQCDSHCQEPVAHWLLLHGFD